MIARPPAASSTSSPWISAFAPTSTPRVGSSTIRTLGVRASQRRTAPSAGCRPRACRPSPRAGAAHVEAVEERSRTRRASLPRRTKPAALWSSSVDERDVLADRAQQKSPSSFRLSGTIAIPRRARVARAWHRDRLSVDQDLAGVEPVGAEDQRAPSRCGRRRRARRARRSRPRARERDVAHAAPRRSPRASSTTGASGRTLLRRIRQVDVAADHRRDERLRRLVRGRARADDARVAHHGHRLGTRPAPRRGSGRRARSSCRRAASARITFEQPLGLVAR